MTHPAYNELELLGRGVCVGGRRRGQFVGRARQPMTETGQCLVHSAVVCYRSFSRRCQLTGMADVLLAIRTRIVSARNEAGFVVYGGAASAKPFSLSLRLLPQSATRR